MFSNIDGGVCVEGGCRQPRDVPAAHRLWETQRTFKPASTHTHTHTRLGVAAPFAALATPLLSPTIRNLNPPSPSQHTHTLPHLFFLPPPSPWRGRSSPYFICALVDRVHTHTRSLKLLFSSPDRPTFFRRSKKIFHKNKNKRWRIEEEPTRGTTPLEYVAHVCVCVYKGRELVGGVGEEKEAFIYHMVVMTTPLLLLYKR